MSQSTVEFAREVAAVHRRTISFTATQRVRAGGIEIEARVRQRGPRALSLEYLAYASPLTDLEETLTGEMEYSPDEIVGLSFHVAGDSTWIYDPHTETAIQKPYRALMEPIPGISALGDVAFLRHLVRDYYLRDRSVESIAGRDLRVLGLKPKRPVRHHLLTTVTFPIRRATVYLDEATLFPGRIHVYPLPGTGAHAIVGHDGRIEVEYSDVRIEPDDVSPFEPRATDRILRERSVPIDDVPGAAPFAVPIEPLAARGFSVIGGRAILTVDDQGERGFATVACERLGTEDEAEGDERRPGLTLHVGNYLSRRMARRRVAASEEGEALEGTDPALRILDRAPRWQNLVPQAVAATPPIDASWEHDGVFWDLAGMGIDQDELVEIAREMSGNASDEPADDCDSAAPEAASA